MAPSIVTLSLLSPYILDDKGAIHTALYNHSTFALRDTQGVLDVVEGRTVGSSYTRYGLNPTIRSVEEKLAAIEGGEQAWVFSSGMAAESATPRSRRASAPRHRFGNMFSH